MNILINLNIKPGSIYCGECEYLSVSKRRCCFFNVFLELNKLRLHNKSKRCPACIDAEKAAEKLKSCASCKWFQCRRDYYCSYYQCEIYDLNGLEENPACENWEARG